MHVCTREARSCALRTPGVFVDAAEAVCSIAWAARCIAHVHVSLPMMRLSGLRAGGLIAHSPLLESTRMNLSPIAEQARSQFLLIT
jgi:hypothetical protein